MINKTKDHMLHQEPGTIGLPSLLEHELVDLKQRLQLNYQPDMAMKLIYHYRANQQKDLCKAACRRLLFGLLDAELTNEVKSILAWANQKNDVSPTPIKKDKLATIHQQGLNEHMFATLPNEIQSVFDGLIGMTSIKDQLALIAYEAVLNQKRRANDLGDSGLGSYHFMITGNPGTGKTTVARLIAKLLYYYNIRQTDRVIEVDKSMIVGKYVGHTEDNIKTIIEEAQGATLFIDEAYTLYQEGQGNDFGKKALEVLMKAMEDKRDAFSVILVGYKKEMMGMLEANPGIQSRINFTLDIPDYTDEELVLIAQDIAENHMGMVIDDTGLQAIKQRLNRDRIDEQFANARYIRELLLEAKRNLSIRLAKTGQYDDRSMSVLLAQDFGQGNSQTPLEVIEMALTDLKSMIGLSQVKDHVNKMVSGIRIQNELAARGIQGPNLPSPNMHMLFAGNPGTGKTSVARKIGQIYGALNLLKRPDVFIEASRADLVANHLGQTATKVKKLIKSALGGILFIDEAYALVQGEQDAFGKEAIDTLIAEMENHRSSLMVILAGYQEPLDQLLQTNSGFKSRISHHLHFEDYTCEELLDIFKGLLLNQQLTCSSEVLEHVKDHLKRQAVSPDFGNARGVRNLVESMVQNKNLRIMLLMDQGHNVIDTALFELTTHDLPRL